jgi:hypothetical protein
MWMTGYRWGLLAAVASVIATVGTAMAQNSTYPRLHTNEAYLEEVTRTSTLAIADPVAVFAFVLDSLPDRVKVYPTGNYHYFRFIQNGTPYVGNIRLHTLDRDSGKVHFAYYADADLARWAGGEAEPALKRVGVILDAAHGVTVEQLESLVYRVTYGRKSVVFALNDLSQVKPPANALRPNERFVGPISDESGMRFFLVYNSRLKIFHYILDETVRVLDDFVPSRLTHRIIIGKRTGFAFYRDHQRNRKILIGVFEGNRWANNYFDGPFDQLPDNFIAGEALREIILEVEPRLKGRIDRLGYALDYTSRYTIAPYLHYQKEDDLSVVHLCVTGSKFQGSVYYQCFVDDSSRSGVHPRPVALTKGSSKPSGSKRE